MGSEKEESASFLIAVKDTENFENFTSIIL